MRKFVALFVLLAMFALCVPSYGYILVYKADIVGKGVDANANSGDGAPLSVSAKAFLILDMDDTDNDLLQGNLLVYGKMAGFKLYLEMDDVASLTRWDNDTITTLSMSIFSEGDDSILVGKVSNRFVGVGVKKPIPGFQKGRLVQADARGIGWVLDTNILFVGYMDFAPIWDEFATKKANKAELSLAEETAALATYLEDHGYVNAD